MVAVFHLSVYENLYMNSCFLKMVETYRQLVGAKMEMLTILGMKARRGIQNAMEDMTIA